MNNINKQWENAVKEFSKRAFERFDDNDLFEFLDSNEVTEYYIRLKHDIQLKPIGELFEHDMQFYGDDAYLMWKISLSDKNRFIGATDNKDVEWALNSTNYDVRRKTRAALPFDLIRAKAGHIVEWFESISNNWITLDSNAFIKYDSTLIEVQGITYASQVLFPYGLANIDINDLRMKYPPNVYLKNDEYHSIKKRSALNRWGI
jgi:hypothetical protein